MKNGRVDQLMVCGMHPDLPVQEHIERYFQKLHFPYTPAVPDAHVVVRLHVLGRSLISFDKCIRIPRRFLRRALLVLVRMV